MSPDAACEQVEKCLQQGAYAPAADICRSVLRDHPEEARLQAFLGVALKNLGQADAAQTCFLKALEVAPDNVTALTHVISPAIKGDGASRSRQRTEIAGLKDRAVVTRSQLFNQVAFGLLVQQLHDCLDDHGYAEAAEICQLALAFLRDSPDKHAHFLSLQAFYSDPQSRLLCSEYDRLSELAADQAQVNPLDICARLNPVDAIPSIEVTGRRTAVPYPSTAVHTHGIEQNDMPESFVSPPVFMACARNGTVTDNFLVIAENGDLVCEDFTPFPLDVDGSTAVSSIYKEIQGLRRDAALLRLNGRLRHVKEPCILLSGGPNGAGNYYHWMIDYLPRLALVEKEPRLAGLKIIVNSGLSSFQKQTLDALGIDQSRLIEKEPGDWLFCDELFVPCHMSRTGLAHPDAIRFLRQKFLPAGAERTETGAKRVYLSRSDAKTRQILNERQVEELLRQHQFDIVVPGTIPVSEQVSALADADFVVVAHGAALANLAFAPRGCRVLELMTKRHLSGLTIASCMGQAYRHLLALPEKRGQNVEISMDDLNVALSELLAASA